MKAFIIILSVTISIVGYSQTNWSNSSTGVSPDFITRAFIPNGTSELYAIGDSIDGSLAVSLGRIIKTSDDGNSWTSVVTNGLPNGEGSYSAGVNTGTQFLIHAQDGTTKGIFASTDMVNWSLSNNGIPTTFQVEDFIVVSTSEIYALGWGPGPTPLIYKSTDGGSNWASVSTSGLPVADNRCRAGVYMDQSMLLSTSDTWTSGSSVYGASNGQSWSVLSANLASEFEIFDFEKLSSTAVWAIGTQFSSLVPSGGYIYESTDGGVSWSLGSHTGFGGNDLYFYAMGTFGNYHFISVYDDFTGSYIYRTGSTTDVETNAGVSESKELVMITDLIGREVGFKANQVQLYVYDNGTVERKLSVK